MTDVRHYRGQVYGRMGVLPHTCRNGRETTLIIWGSFCATCGDRYTFTVPGLSKKFQPNRRCQRCKRPGRRVRQQS